MVYLYASRCKFQNFYVPPTSAFKPKSESLITVWLPSKRTDVKQVR